jgi:tRNA U34 5-methylaminomethyl-2-thiouridine-forming methyltransferase MnmC
MEISLRKTNDGSNTIYIEELNENYHSTEGAISESLHVYINSGLKKVIKNDINILEIGFGTGLNLILTYIENLNLLKKIYYETIEAFPIKNELVNQLNYPEQLNIDKNIFLEIHNSEWEKIQNLGSNFSYKKIKSNLINFIPENNYDLVYFDAFAPDKQPELWTFDIFQKIYSSMNEGGILVTYSSKGIVKTALRNCGFELKRLKGFGKKRHILFAIKKT